MVISIIFVSFLITGAVGDPREIVSRTDCKHGTLKLECPDAYIIKIIRTDRATCQTNRKSTNYTACVAPESSKHIVGRKCDGEQSCLIEASNDVFGDPCVGTFEHLNVSYGCVPIHQGETCVDVPCASWDFKYATCNIPSSELVTQVSLTKQVSKTNCEEPIAKFGTRDGKIWVDEGCRGNFSVCLRKTLHDYLECPGTSRWSGKELDHECYVPYERNITKLSLIKRFSTNNCTFGLDTSNDGRIWVSEGCHGIFYYSYTIKKPTISVCFFGPFRSFGVKEIVGIIGILLVIIAIAKLSHMKFQSRKKMNSLEDFDEDTTMLIMDLTMEKVISDTGTVLSPKHGHNEV